MHMYIAIRGHYDRLNRWVGDCLARYYSFTFGKDKKGKDKVGMVQLSMRPIQLYEVVFPSEHLGEVCSIIQPYGGYGFQEGIKKKLMKYFTKILKLKPIPKFPIDKSFYHDNVDVLGIGIKEDKFCKEKQREDL